MKPFIPRPRRCFYCQEFGHVVTSCRLKDQGKPSICKNCGEEEHGICTRISKCIHCGSNHPASSFECDVYLFEKEVQATRTKERISFAEAKEKVLTKFIRPGISFARVATDRRFLKMNRIIHTRTAPRMKRTLSKESLAENNAKKKVVTDNAPIDTGASTSMKVIATKVHTSSSLEAVPAVAGVSASSEAAPAAAGVSASSEAAPAVAGASASLEAASAVAGASVSLEAVPALAGQVTSSEAVQGVADVTSMEVASIATSSSSAKKSKTTSTQIEEEEENSMSELYASCNSLPDLTADMPVRHQKTGIQNQSPKKQRLKSGSLQNKGKNKTQSNPVNSANKSSKNKVLQRNSGVQSSKSK